MSRRLATATARALSTRIGRRGFLARAALAGSALAVAPMRYVLQPGTAYAAVCRCSGRDCNCGAQCCDGYTEFCCTLNGANTCPSGTVPAGWWKADGSGFCDVNGQGRPRYYLDCNSLSCGSCGCRSNGTCHHSCDPFTCGCASGSCNNRKTACTGFRYGQCNNHIACVGSIVCRVVTCTPPWQLDSNCSTVSATDNATRFHNAPCLHGSTQLDVPVFGDWNGDGVHTPGVFRNGIWYLRNSMDSGGPDTMFAYGQAGDIPVVGDWAGRGHTGIGVVRGRRWMLKLRAERGHRDFAFSFGEPGDIPVVGDWNGTGKTGPGMFRNGRWLLKNKKASGSPNFDFRFGGSGDLPVVGDWLANGTTHVGVVDDGVWKLRTSQSAGSPNIEFNYGDPDDLAISGDWNGDGVASAGVVRGTRWFLRNKLTSGGAQTIIDFDTTLSPEAAAPLAVAVGEE